MRLQQKIITQYLQLQSVCDNMVQYLPVVPCNINVKAPVNILLSKRNAAKNVTMYINAKHYSSNTKVSWEITGNATFVYNSIRITS